MSAVTVLLAGGPADGRWVTVSKADLDVVEIAEFPKWGDPDSLTVKHLYRAQEVELCGWKLWVALHSELCGIERSQAVLKAVLQRDVARQMGVIK